MSTRHRALLVRIHNSRITLPSLIAYGILLITSGLVQLRTTTTPQSLAHVTVTLDQRPVRIAYRDTAPGRTDLPAVLLLHGSPGSGEVMEPLMKQLGSHFRLIAPDLPGFGESTRHIPDYSFRAHAHYMLAFLRQLNISQAQVVAFSMGGGVALSMTAASPQAVTSIVMLSAIGVQEHEWTGGYWGNHILHGLQLGALWLLHTAIPHYGALNRIMFDIEYARNFYDSDQRPLRHILETYRGPMLIIHGRHDPLVPLAAALEHHRIVQQSELLQLDENHFMAFLKPEVFAPQLIDYLRRNSDPAKAGTL
ncbi:MAG: alpha/beta hydrolase [Acidobacteria bacterium]|nr:alpha/beta hydrolase [Acidobacteriota bacterium]